MDRMMIFRGNESEKKTTPISCFVWVIFVYRKRRDAEMLQMKAIESTFNIFLFEILFHRSFKLKRKIESLFLCQFEFRTNKVFLVFLFLSEFSCTYCICCVHCACHLVATDADAAKYDMKINCSSTRRVCLATDKKQQQPNKLLTTVTAPTFVKVNDAQVDNWIGCCDFHWEFLTTKTRQRKKKKRVTTKTEINTFRFSLLVLLYFCSDL